MKNIVSALVRAGARPDEVFVLAGVAYILTRANVGWYQGSPQAVGAWGVSVDVYGRVPDDANGQAAQALQIYRSRNLATSYYAKKPVASLVDIAIKWWRPHPPQETTDRLTKLYTPLAIQYVKASQKEDSGFPWLGLIAGVLILVFFLKKKK